MARGREAEETERPTPAELEERHRQLLGRYQELVGKYRRASEQHGSIQSLGNWLLLHSDEGVALLRDGKLVVSNRRYRALCAGRKWTCISSPNAPGGTEMKGILAALAATATDDSPRSFLHRAIAPDQGTIELRVQRLGPDGDEIAAVVRDETEAQLLREKSAEALRRDEFLAMLGHELRNLLAPIVSSAETILRIGDGDQVERSARAILQQAQHQARILEDLLDTARVQQGKVSLRPERTDLRRVVEEAVGATNERRREIRLSLHLPEQPVWVEIDPTRIAQCVINLLVNAAKFTPAGGENRLEVETREDVCWVRVRDTGVGIAPSALASLFELFAQGERSLDGTEQGLGLGLPLVRSLVELHGGRVYAYSAGPGAGSEFAFSLPLAAEAAATGPLPDDRNTAASSVGNRPSGDRRRVLLVDDSLPALETLGELLELEGHEVLTASNAEEAEERLRAARDEPPDVVISDIGMPGMDGYELAARLRELLPEATLIALSGRSGAEYRERARAAGFDACLVKPVDLQSLTAAIDSAPDHRSA